MSHRRRTRTARLVLTAGIMACLACLGFTATWAAAQSQGAAASDVDTETASEGAQTLPDDGTAPAVSTPDSESAPTQTSDPAEPGMPTQPTSEPTEGVAPPADLNAPTKQPSTPPASPGTGPNTTPAPPAGSADELAAAEALKPAPPEAPPPVAESSTPWSFALTAGYYSPRLGTLNRVIQDTSITFVQDPNFLLPRNQDFTFEQRNLSVDQIGGGPVYGVDAFYSPGGAHSFGLSFSGWHGESVAQDTISVLLRSDVDPIPAPRSARYNLVLDQIFLEWRYHLFRSQEGKGLYVNVGLLGISLAYFTMDALVNVVDPQLSFASVSSDESFGWGYTTRFGVGGDFPLTSWLSIGGRANYILGNIRRMDVTRHFSAGFPQFPVPNALTIRPGVALPQLFFDPSPGDPVTYARVVTTGDIQEDVGRQSLLTLELSGWEGLLEVAVHF